MSVSLTCPGAAPGACQATLTLKTTNHADTLHVVTVGQANTTIPAGQSKTVTITLNQTGRQLLAKRGSLETTLTVTQSAERVASKIVWFRPT